MGRLRHRLDAARDDLRDEPDVALELVAGRRGRPAPPSSSAAPSACRRSRRARARASGRSPAASRAEPSAAVVALRRGGDHARVRATLPIALVLVLLAAGCDSGSKQRHAAATGPAVPWVASTAAAARARAPAKAACRSTDLTIPGQVKFIARLQGGIALVTIRNTGKRACRLTGRPRVRLVKRGGPAQVQRPIPPTPSNFPEVAYPTSSLLALRPGEAAAVTITWDNWCDRHPGQAARAAERVADHAPRRPRGPRRRLQRRPAVPRPGAAVDDRRLPLPAEPPPRGAVLVGRLPAGRSRASRCTAPRPHAALRRRPEEHLADDGDFERCPAYIEQLVPAAASRRTS